MERRHTHLLKRPRILLWISGTGNGYVGLEKNRDIRGRVKAGVERSARGVSFSRSRVSLAVKISHTVVRSTVVILGLHFHEPDLSCLSTTNSKAESGEARDGLLLDGVCAVNNKGACSAKTQRNATSALPQTGGRNSPRFSFITPSI